MNAEEIEFGQLFIMVLFSTDIIVTFFVTLIVCFLFRFTTKWILIITLSVTLLGAAGYTQHLIEEDKVEGWIFKQKVEQMGGL